MVRVILPGYEPLVRNEVFFRRVDPLSYGYKPGDEIAEIIRLFKLRSHESGDLTVIAQSGTMYMWILDGIRDSLSEGFCAPTSNNWCLRIKTKHGKMPPIEELQGCADQVVRSFYANSFPVDYSNVKNQLRALSSLTPGMVEQLLTDADFQASRKLLKTLFV